MPALGCHYIDKVNSNGKRESVLIKENFEILGCLADSDEIEMFASENLTDLIDYKWESYGFYFHLIGTTIHLSYLILLFIYTVD